MSDYELIQRALDANAFTTDDTAAGYVNPSYWDSRIIDHVRANTVGLQFGEDRSAELSPGGASLKITLDAEPSAVASIAESTATTVVAWAPTQGTITPVEFSTAYQISDKEIRRAFLSVMERFAANIGYVAALSVDASIIATLISGAGNSIVANSVASTAVASSDTLDYADVIAAMKANAIDKYMQQSALIVRPEQAADLMKDTSFLTADKFGSSAAVFSGFLGKVMGIPVFMTTQSALVSSTKAYALLLSHPKPFAYVFHAGPGPVMHTDYDVLGRFWTVQGAVDFGCAVVRANSICKIYTYCA